MSSLDLLSPRRPPSCCEESEKLREHFEEALSRNRKLASRTSELEAENAQLLKVIESLQRDVGDYKEDYALAKARNTILISELERLRGFKEGVEAISKLTGKSIHPKFTVGVPNGGLNELTASKAKEEPSQGFIEKAKKRLERAERRMRLSYYPPFGRCESKETK